VKSLARMVADARWYATAGSPGTAAALAEQVGRVPHGDNPFTQAGEADLHAAFEIGRKRAPATAPKGPPVAGRWRGTTHAARAVKEDD